MKYLPSIDLQAALVKDGLEQFCAGVDLPDDELRAQIDYYRSHPIHAGESDQELLDRAAYFLLWRDHGVPQGSDKSVAAVDGLNAKRITVMHEALREMCREHFPKLREDFSDVKKSASVQANNAQALNSQMVQFIGEIHSASLRTATALQGVRGAVVGSSQCSREDAAELKVAIAKGLRRLGRIALWSAALISLLLTALIILTAKAHAQGGIDGVVVQQAGSNVGNPVSGGYLKLNFASGCTVTAGAGPIRNISCTSSSPLTTKGDIFGFSTVNARIPVGTDGLCLKADSANANGVSYSACSGAATGYQTIQNAAVAITQRTILNWTAGILCSDNAGATRSDCALTNVAAVSHKFFNSVVSGALVLAQPDFGDLTGTATTGQLPTVPVSKGGTNSTSAGVNGQVLICNGVDTCAPGDPIVSYNYVNLWTTQDVTVTRTSAATRVSTFGAYGSLLTTWAGITGSPAGCTVQIKSGDSAGNFINNGSAISVSPANGTTAAIFSPAATLPTQSQMQAVFACGTYPTAGTLTLEFAPAIAVSANVASLAGTAIDTNSGSKSAGTQRVVIATDQPQLTNALKVDGSAVTQPVSGTVTTTPPANASTNVAQVAGTTTSVNSGTKDAGTLRVVLATDQPQLTNKLLVTPDSVALPANQSVNVNQIAGANISTAAAGTQLVGVADGAGNKITTNSSTYTAKFAFDSNFLGTLGTAFTTPGFVDIKGADGNVFVRQATGTNLHMVCDSGCSSSAGFTDNSAFTVGTTAINNLGAYYTSGADPTLSTGNSGRVRMDSHSYLLVDGSLVTQPVSGTFWQATQPVSIADGSDTTLGAKADAKSTATDTTAVTAMQVLKEISAMEQAPASRAVTNAGTFAVQEATLDGAITSNVLQANVKQINGVTPLMGNGVTGTGSQRVTVASDNTPFPVKTDQTTHGTTDLVAADVTKVGGTALALGQAVSTASIPVVVASDQSPLAVFARTMPLLNYSSFVLQDANTVLWVTTMSDTGALNTVTTTSGTVLPLYFNDIATRTTYQIGVSTAGVLTETPVTFNPQYPAAIGFVTSGGKKSALLMNSAVFYSLQPTSVVDWNVAVGDGGDVTQGAIADVKVTGDVNGTLSAKLRGINYSLAQIAQQTNVSIKAQIQPTRLVGALNQPIGTPASPISVLPANASGCAGSSPQMTMSAPINMSTAVTTKIITGSAAGWTYICAIDLVVAGADNTALVYGTGSNCGTGTTALAGGTTAATGWNLAANGGLAKGNGQGILWKVPPGNDTCLATSAAVQASGSLTFAQL